MINHQSIHKFWGSVIKQANQNILVKGMFSTSLPQRRNDAHKGTFGSVAIIGGDASMVGAVLLASRAAQLSGAGRVYAALLSSDAPCVDELHPEIMFRKPAELSKLAQLDCIVIGPGLGQTNAAKDLLEFWLRQDKAILIDADALNLIANHTNLVAIIKSRVADTVITPHAGEAARLLQTTSEQIQQNRTESAFELARNLKAICVLKGAGTVVAQNDGSWFINSTGNVGLASGGTGDVLSGIVGSLMAQGLSGLEAAKLGVYVHGAAADALVARGFGPIGLTASELALEVRNILNQLNQKRS
jgi:ADP-dependent NAD(P)H-hydrate dehydratase / NAD(P)H-hydrate epimerase